MRSPSLLNQAYQAQLTLATPFAVSEKVTLWNTIAITTAIYLRSSHFELILTEVRHLCETYKACTISANKFSRPHLLKNRL